MTPVKAIQNDTFDSIAYRYFKDQSTAMLPALLEANAHIEDVVLAEHQIIHLPEQTQIQRPQTLKLWD